MLFLRSMYVLLLIAVSVQAQGVDITKPAVPGKEGAPTVTEVTLQAWEKDWVDRIHAALVSQTPDDQKSAILKEQVLFDGTRADLLTPNYAIEVDWAYKWAEGIGQSLHYSLQTDRPPAVILLMRDKTREARFVQRCKTVGVKYDIKVWVVDTVKARLYVLDGTFVPIPPLQPAALVKPK